MMTAPSPKLLESLNELCNTEIAFIENIKQLVDNSKTFLDIMLENRSVFEKETIRKQWNAIIESLRQILYTNISIFFQNVSYTEQPTDETLIQDKLTVIISAYRGELLSKKVAAHEAYARLFFSSITNFLELLRKKDILNKLKNSVSWQQAFKNLSGKPVLALDAILDKPVARLSKTVITLKEIDKFLPEEHCKKKGFSATVVNVEKQSQRLNSSVEQSQQEYQEQQRTIKIRDETPIHPAFLLLIYNILRLVDSCLQSPLGQKETITNPQWLGIQKASEDYKEILQELSTCALKAYCNAREQGALDNTKQSIKTIANKLTINPSNFSTNFIVKINEILNPSSVGKSTIPFKVLKIADLNKEDQDEEIQIGSRSNLDTADVQENYIQQHLLQRLTQNFNGYRFSGTTKANKNRWKKNLLDGIDKKVENLSNQNYESRVLELRLGGVDIWQWSVNLLKSSLVEKNRFPFVAGKGGFYTYFNKTVDFLDSIKPNTVPTATTQLTTSPNTNTQRNSQKLSADKKNDPMILLFIILRMKNYYCHDGLGNEFCVQNKISPNTNKNKWMPEISQLASAAIKLYLTDPENFSTDALINLINTTINKIRPQFGGKNSRLANSLSELVNQIKPNTYSLDRECQKLPALLISADQIDTTKAQSYVQRHVVKQVHETFNQYTLQKDSRFFSRFTNRNKDDCSDNIINALDNLMDSSVESCSNILTNIRKIFTDNLKPSGSIHKEYFNKDFGMAYKKVLNYIHSITPDIKAEKENLRELVFPIFRP